MRSCKPNILSSSKDGPFRFFNTLMQFQPILLLSVTLLLQTIFSRLARLCFHRTSWKGRAGMAKPSRNFTRGYFMSCILRSPHCVSAASADSGYASHYAGRFPQVTFPIVSLTRRDCRHIASKKKCENNNSFYI